MILLVIGALFVFFSALGLLRMPDIYTRLSTTTKANTLGIGALLIAFILTFWGDLGILAKSLLAFVFVLITVPISGHYLGRVAYFIGIKRADAMKTDELAHKFGQKRQSDKKK